MFTVISVYNDRQVLDEYLLRSLDRQTVGCERRLVDNTRGAFASAAEALNHGAKDAKGDYLLFAHQDVALCHRDWLESAERTVRTLPNLGMAGAAGKRGKGNDNFSNAENAPIPTAACHNRLTAPVKVQTLDECLTIVPKDVFAEHRYDTALRLGWHLYAVEYCLRLGRLGYGVYVIPEPVYHWAGMRYAKRLSRDYFDSLAALLPEYRDYKRIHTTCGDWNTRLPAHWQNWRGWRHLYKVRPFIMKGHKTERVIASLTALPRGRKLVNRCTLPQNARTLLDIAKGKTYAYMREDRKPILPADRDRLTATDINEHLVTLELLARELRHKRILELGVDSGQSTLSFLRAAKAIGGHVVSVDITDCPKAKEKVALEGLADHWFFMRRDDMTLPWSEPIDHLFIDTSHGYGHTLAELEKFEPYVVPGGVITMHDIISFPGVQRAIDRYLDGRRDLRQYSFYNNNGLAVIFKDAGE